MADPAQTAIAVKSTTGMLTAAGVWSGVIMLALTLVIAVVRIWPKLREQGLGWRKSQIDRLDERIGVLEQQIVQANDRAQAAEDQARHSKTALFVMNSAFALVTGELRRHEPDNPVLKQAQDMIAVAVTGDTGMDNALLQLSRLPGIAR